MKGKIEKRIPQVGDEVYLVADPDMDPDVLQLWDELGREKRVRRMFDRAITDFVFTTVLGFAGFALAIVIISNRVRALEKNGSIKH